MFNIEERKKETLEFYNGVTHKIRIGVTFSTSPLCRSSVCVIFKAYWKRCGFER